MKTRFAEGNKDGLSCQMTNARHAQNPEQKHFSLTKALSGNRHGPTALFSWNNKQSLSLLIIAIKLE